MTGEGLSVQLAARVLDASASGYYEWQSRAPSARSIRHALLTDAIRELHTFSRGTYGFRRVHAELTLVRASTEGPPKMRRHPCDLARGFIPYDLSAGREYERCLRPAGMLLAEGNIRAGREAPFW